MKKKSHGKHDDLLASLLTPLLQEWGRDSVLACIQELETSSSLIKQQQRPNKVAQSQSPGKPNAVGIASRTELPVAKRDALLSLASLFDQKHFLPTAADVRSFLELRTQHSGAIKQRQEAFRKVLTLLASMTNEELERLIGSSTHAGPTQLGPLSDAIRATGAVMRSIDTSSNDSNKQSPAGESTSATHPARNPDDDQKNPSK
ncbi:MULTISPECIES: hypothetical protein [unclassified Xanthomonas]|uniref:hypothetical protein n=1 Tax=Xanthomonas sp. LMG 8992 TaxID=1591157 RepID=UPI0013703CB3|nr:hypothetical protein [Xanthomonas sp. LMG 8992]